MGHWNLGLRTSPIWKRKFILILPPAIAPALKAADGVFDGAGHRAALTADSPTSLGMDNAHDRGITPQPIKSDDIEALPVADGRLGFDVEEEGPFFSRFGGVGGIAFSYPFRPEPFRDGDNEVRHIQNIYPGIVSYLPYNRYFQILAYSFLK